MMSGCAQAICYAMTATCDPRTNVIMPQPGYAMYKVNADSRQVEARFYDHIYHVSVCMRACVRACLGGGGKGIYVCAYIFVCSCLLYISGHANHQPHCSLFAHPTPRHPSALSPPSLCLSITLFACLSICSSGWCLSASPLVCCVHGTMVLLFHPGNSLTISLLLCVPYTISFLSCRKMARVWVT